jgi:cystathionine gamma-synthase
MSKDARQAALATQMIHGAPQRDAYGSPHTPVYNTTTYRFETTADLLDVVEGRSDGYLYTRYGHNPTIAELEYKLAALESAGSALAFASGMAAISATLLAHGRNGVVCIGDLYGGTYSFLTEQCQSLGIPVQFLLDGELAQLGAALNQRNMLVYCETPANPTLSILDIRQLAAIAHHNDALLAVDNTFASPINQQPLKLGADLVLHSATKYLGGHSDLTAGALMAAPDLITAVAGWRKNLGQLLSPETASLLSRSLKTLSVRVRQHNENAMAVARAVSGHPRITRTLYPGLEDFPGHALAQQQMQGFGGMMAIEVRGGAEAAAEVADRLQLFLLAPSLGGVESLITQPSTTSHYDLSEEARAQRGISDGLLRLSVGLENSDDLIADLNQALRVCR